jgi:hypothetical protein
MEQLKEDITAFRKEIPDEIFVKMDDIFSDIETDIVVPSLWKR